MAIFRALAPEVRASLDAVASRAVLPLGAGLAVLLGYTAFSELDQFGTDLAAEFWADVVAASVMALVAIGRLVRLPDRFANPALAAIALASTMTSAVAKQVQGDSDFIDLVLVILGSGLLMTSRRWLAVTLVGVWIGWGYSQGEYLPWPGHSGELELLIATVISVAVFWTRWRASMRIYTSEEELKASLENAHALNEQLGRFASTVAHDLQNPVAAMRMKAGALRLRVPDENDEAQRIITDMDKVAATMGEMIVDIMAQAKAEHAGGPGTADLDAIMAELQTIFAERLDEIDGALESGSLPEIHAPATQMKQLLVNLIGNSLHYRRDEEPLKISIHGTRIGAGVILTVTDNGQGFELRKAEDLFGEFARGDTDKEGHGIGLATCKRIVADMGGSIKAGAQPGHGAVFTIWLPDQEDEVEAQGNGRPPPATTPEEVQAPAAPTA